MASPPYLYTGELRNFHAKGGRYTEGDSKFGILAKPALADFQMKN
jgi:hypothetical protein